MRKVTKNYGARPLSLQVNRRYYREALAGVQIAGKWTDAASGLYSAAPVQTALEAIYHCKCAFCELKPLGSPAQVEHFRPRRGVTGIVHTGYYWLAYEWSNLLLACGNCNSRKGNKFPVRTEPARVQQPTIVNGVISESANFILNQPLLSEAFVLLNPEVDQPDQHIAYEHTGKIVHLTDRGEQSIKTYDLNRDELYLTGRKKIIDDLYAKLFKRLDRYRTGERSAAVVIADISDVLKEDLIRPIVLEYSFVNFYKQILLHFDAFVINRFGGPKERLLLKFGYANALL